jgi:archaellum component FlaF (FlaF/FlaG flagellin family)
MTTTATRSLADIERTAAAICLGHTVLQRTDTDVLIAGLLTPDVLAILSDSKEYVECSERFAITVINRDAALALSDVIQTAFGPIPDRDNALLT